MNPLLSYGLTKFQMTGASTSLVEVKAPDSLSIQEHSVEEIIAIENAFEFGANYIYFRRFNNRPPVPQVYVYDFTINANVSRDELIRLHQRLYSSGHVPMFFVFTKSDVIIFNCFDRPASGNKLTYKPLLTIELAAEVEGSLNTAKKKENEEYFKAFSGPFFDNGSFWESSSFSKHFHFSNSAYEKLLSELKLALNDIVTNKILPETVARKLLVVSILIKYLEERRDEYDNTVFPKAGEERIVIKNGRRQKQVFTENFFEQFAEGATSFTNVLKIKGAILKLLDYLARHFNGGVFQLTKQERKVIEKADLRRFALFLEGNVVNGVQYVFWRLYSFNDLPVELISNIYEEFLEKRPGVVYTPPYLVNFLLDEVIPLAANETSFRVLDPACGSGVFLVGAYRRLIYRWRKNNNWKKPTLSVLKQLLKANIFGSDKDPDAVNLTIFSLSLALCDELTPIQIWEDLQFNNLHNENIFDQDFFQLLSSNTFSKSFDLVIGNPPFEAKLTECANKIETDTIKKRVVTITDSKGSAKTTFVKLPDNQIALLFLEQSIALLKPNAITCLIQPSAPLLYNNTSFLFRKYLFEKYAVPQIIDFTHISRILFGKSGDVPTAAIFIKNAPPDKKGMLHVTVRRTKPHKEKIYFDLDSYDFHYVPKKLAVSDPHIWKSNFVGGSRFHQLISRLRSFGTLKDYLAQKIKSDGWGYGEGFIQGKLDEIKELEKLFSQKKFTLEETQRLEYLNKKYKAAPYITGKPLAINDHFANHQQLMEIEIINKEKFFRYPSKEKLFTPPHILVKEEINNDKIPILFSNSYLTFKHRVVGIHAPQNEANELKKIFNYLQSNLILFYLAGTSAEYMVNRSSSFLKKDLDNLPYIEDANELKLSDDERILLEDFWKYLLEFRRNGETSKIATRNAKPDELEVFGNTFCEVLNTVYKTLKPHPYFETQSYICYPFYFKTKPKIIFSDNGKAEKNIETLVKRITGTSVRMTRVVRIYENNVIYLIKPKQLRYWLRSTALRDADETFADLRKQGY